MMGRKSPKVFVIDDSPDSTFCRAIGLYLQTGDVSCHTPDSIHESEVDVLVDYVILDIMMYWGEYLDLASTEGGYMTGFALLSDVHEKCPNAKIIILTALHGEMFDSLKKQVESYAFVASVLQKPQSIKMMFRGL